jgi:CheY-like chemotaxis protein
MEGILLIEDDDDMRDNLAALLRRRGYQVAAVGNGKEALEWLQMGNMPCLIILDLMMPVMNGWDFRSKQMAVQKWAAIPTVLLSGTADIAQQMKRLGTLDYISKPVNLKRLYDIVDRYYQGAQRP